MKVQIILANKKSAEDLKNISINAFKNGFEKYGHYPPGIESLDWHLSEIKKEYYYQIKYENKLAGGICLVPTDKDHMEIKYFFIGSKFQNIKIGSKVIKLIENKYDSIKNRYLVTPYKEYRNHHFYEKLGYIKIGEIKENPDNDFKLYEYQKLKK